MHIKESLKWQPFFEQVYVYTTVGTSLVQVVFKNYDQLIQILKQYIQVQWQGKQNNFEWNEML